MQQGLHAIANSETRPTIGFFGFFAQERFDLKSAVAECPGLGPQPRRVFRAMEEANLH